MQSHEDRSTNGLPDKIVTAKLSYLDSALQDLISTASAIWNWIGSFTIGIPDLLVPKVVRVEISLEKQLSDAIAQAVRDPGFRTQLINHPKQTLASSYINIPPQQEVTVWETTATQTFLVLPIMTDLEIEQLQVGATSSRSSRSIRSRILLDAWQNSDYRSRLFADPKALLLAEGFQIPANTTVTILENSPEHLYLVIPTVH
jgi:hypothetical protein